MFPAFIHMHFFVANLSQYAFLRLLSTINQRRRRILFTNSERVVFMQQTFFNFWNLVWFSLPCSKLGAAQTFNNLSKIESNLQLMHNRDLFWSPYEIQKEFWSDSQIQQSIFSPIKTSHDIGKYISWFKYNPLPWKTINMPYCSLITFSTNKGIRWYLMVLNGLWWYLMIFNGIQWYWVDLDNHRMVKNSQTY